MAGFDLEGFSFRDLYGQVAEVGLAVEMEVEARIVGKLCAHLDKGFVGSALSVG